MSDGKIALIVVGSFLLYSVGIGMYAGLLGWTKADHWEDPRPVVWPILFPAKLGALLVVWMRTPKKSKLPVAKVVDKKPGAR